MSRVRFTRGWKMQRFLRRCRVLQVVERAAVGDGRDQRAELQRRHGDALAEGAHAAHAALLRRQFLVRIDTKLLAGDVVAGQLAQPKLVGIVADALKAERAAQRFKVEIVGVSQRLGQVQMIGRRPG